MGGNVMKTMVAAGIYAAGALVLGFSAPAALAQGAVEPKMVEMVVPNSPGGASDALARVLQRIWVEEGLISAPVTVLNKPGGGGNLTLSYLEQKAGDHGPLAVTSITHQLNYIIGTSQSKYTDFTPIATLVGDYVAFAVRADSPYQTGQDLVDAVKADPQSVSFANTGIGGLNHIPPLQLARAIGVPGKSLNAPVFSSSGDSATAMLGGHVDVAVGSVGNLAKFVEAGQARILGITAPERLPGTLSNLPTWKEQGFDVVFSSWRGFWGAPDLTPEQIAFWDHIIAETKKSPIWAAELEKHSWSDEIRTAAETRAEFDRLQADLVDMLTELGLAQNTD
jgi:putative tricarboxylic transport membrane protein